ncbi:MAG: VOC family protein [Pseudomonadota bacterium]|nr:VOC family protein [Pseudomonadota bacterium]
MIKRFDGMVLTVADVVRSQAFYKTVFNMEPITEGSSKGVRFEEQTIWLQNIGEELRHHALEGASHIVLLTMLPPETLSEHFQSLQVELLEPPKDQGTFVMFLMHDLDRNLIAVKSLKQDV